MMIMVMINYFPFLLLQWSDKDSKQLWNPWLHLYQNVSILGPFSDFTLSHDSFSAKNIYASFKNFKLWKIICQKENHSCLFCFTCAELFPSPQKQNFFKSPDPPWKKSIWRTIENPKTIYLLNGKTNDDKQNESFIASHLYYDNMKWILQTLWMLSPRNTNCFWSILDNPTWWFSSLTKQFEFDF